MAKCSASVISPHSKATKESWHLMAKSSLTEPRSKRSWAAHAERAGRAGSEARVCPNEPHPSLVAYAGWPPGCLGLLLLGCLCAWLGGVGAGCMRYLVEAAEERVGYNGIHDVEQDQFGGGGSRCRHDEAGGGGQDRHGWRHALVRPGHLRPGHTAHESRLTTAPWRRREEVMDGT